MTNSNIVALRSAKDLLVSRIPGTAIKPIKHISSSDIKQLRKRIQASTYGKLLVISGFEKFKADLAASLKLFFLWETGMKKCEQGSHCLAPVGINEYEPKCTRCGEVISSAEQLMAQ